MPTINQLSCPECGAAIEQYRTPFPTVDVVIYSAARGIVLVERGGEPFGWALPGGFVDYGESCEAAAVREMHEETNLDVSLVDLLGVYSDPQRDPRKHTMSVVYIGVAKDEDRIRGGDDALKACFFELDDLPSPIVFDHERIIGDFKARLLRLQP